MAHMMKSTLRCGWCKTQISKSTQGSFFVFRWGCGVSNGDFEKYQGTFLRKMTIISLEINGNAYICVLLGQIVCNFCCNIENLEHISTIKHFLVLL